MLNPIIARTPFGGITINAEGHLAITQTSPETGYTWYVGITESTALGMISAAISAATDPQETERLYVARRFVKAREVGGDRPLATLARKEYALRGRPYYPRVGYRRRSGRLYAS